jgi:hypothetical protein
VTPIGRVRVTVIVIVIAIETVIARVIATATATGLSDALNLRWCPKNCDNMQKES